MLELLSNVDEEVGSVVRSDVARASALRDPVKAREAAYRAWRTMRSRERLAEAERSVPLQRFVETRFALPAEVASGRMRMKPPLIRPSKLTYVEKGGVGKQLSDGWALNFAVGCTHGCVFCYVDEIQKKFGFVRAGPMVYEEWGNYFGVPENIDELIEETPWVKWRGEEVMLSSTHDPYLPQLYRWTRKILERALPAGVRFCIQTRSPLVERDFDLLLKYREQVRLQVSIATMSERLARAVEPRVVPPSRRLETLRKAKRAGLRTGVIIAPVFPPNRLRPSLSEDLEALAGELAEIKPDHIYGESLHVRGVNLVYVERALGEGIKLEGFDQAARLLFSAKLADHGLSGVWWPEEV